MYPQYYEVISNPVDLRMIAQRILADQYHTFGEIERDFALMARNAKHFNEPKSQIYQVRKRLEGDLACELKRGTITHCFNFISGRS